MSRWPSVDVKQYVGAMSTQYVDAMMGTGLKIEAWSELSTENNDNLILWLRDNNLGEIGHPAFFTASVLEGARVKAIKDLKIPPIP